MQAPKKDPPIASEGFQYDVVCCIMQLLHGSTSAMDDPSHFFGLVQLSVPLFHHCLLVCIFVLQTAIPVSN